MKPNLFQLLQKGLRVIDPGPATEIDTDLDDTSPVRDTTLSDKDLHTHFSDHHPHLIDGLDLGNYVQPDHDTVSGSGNVRILRKTGSHELHSVIKRGFQIDHVPATARALEASGAELLHDPFNTAHRDAAFQAVADKVFGMGEYVPKTTKFLHPDTNHPWSAQEFLGSAHPMAITDRHPASEKLALMDTILGNYDRHSGNILWNKGKPALIDSSFAFDFNNVVHPHFPAHFGYRQDNAVSEEAIKWLSEIQPHALAGELKKRGVPQSYVQKTVSRLMQVRDAAKAGKTHREIWMDTMQPHVNRTNL